MLSTSSMILFCISSNGNKYNLHCSWYWVRISNKLITKSIEINESAILGTLNINVYICFTEPPDEIPEDYVLVDIKDEFESKEISIYKGWMISSSPDVTPLEHPIYDLWLLNCSNDKTS